MSDVAAAPAAASPVAPTNGAHPTTPQKPSETKQPVAAKPPAPAPVDDGEEFTVRGEKVRLTKAEQRLRIQKDIAADKRLQEASEKQKRIEEMEKLFEEDPEAYFQKKGKDPSKFIAAHLERQARAALMTPEQRAAEEKDKRLADYEAREAAAKKDAEARRQQAMDLARGEHIEKGLIAAADKYGLDEDPATLESLRDIAWELSVELEIPDVTFDQVAEEHIRREREHIEKRDKRLLGLLSGKKLLDYLGKDGLAKVKAAMAEADAASLNDIPKPQARPKVAVRAHEREVKGYLRESDFDKKFLK